MMSRRHGDGEGDGTAAAVWDVPTSSVLARLRERFGADAFHIVERWDADVCTLGIVRGGASCLLAVISTCDKPDGCYDLVLEREPLPGADTPFEDGGRHRNVDFETLAHLVGSHLGLLRQQ